MDTLDPYRPLHGGRGLSALRCHETKATGCTRLTSSSHLVNERIVIVIPGNTVIIIILYRIYRHPHHHHHHHHHQCNVRTKMSTKDSLRFSQEKPSRRHRPKIEGPDEDANHTEVSTFACSGDGVPMLSFNFRHPIGPIL